MFKRAMVTSERACKSLMWRDAADLFLGGQPMREAGDYFWIHCGQSDNLELGIVGLNNIVAQVWDSPETC